MPTWLPSLVDAQHDRLHPVIQDLLGNATQLLECRFMQSQQRPKRLVGRYVREHGAAVTQREDKS